MCDPLSGALAVGSLASAGMNYASQADLASQQNAANNEWLAYQNRIRQEQNTQQEDLRKKAEAARQEGLSKLDPKGQADAQAAEASRLNTAMTSGQPAQVTASNVQDKMLSGQQSGGENFKSDLASRVNTATQAARKRIQALATIQSYGGSQGGLQTQNQLGFMDTDNQLGLTNNERAGALKTYQVQQQVEPVHYAAGPSLFGGISNALAGIAGQRIGNQIKSW